MGFTEKDPRDTAYAALYVAINWYCELSSETALQIVKGKSHRLPGRKLTPELLAEIKKIMDSPNFYNINAIVKKFRVNKYEIFEAIAKEKNIRGKNVSGEVLVMQKADEGLKKAHDWTEKCEGYDCGNCIYDGWTFGEYNLCEILTGLEFDGKNLVKPEITAMHKNAQKCTNVKLEGETKHRGFQMYTSVLNELDKFVAEHPNEKVKDIVSGFILNGIKKRKRA